MSIQKPWVKQAFSAAASTYDEAAVLQYEVANKLFEMLKKMGVHPQKMLDIGCGTGRITQELTNYWSSVVTAIDCASGMIDYAKKNHSEASIDYLYADVEDFIFPLAQYDLVWSNFALQWCVDLKGLFKKINHSLTGGGIFAFTLPGEHTLRELKTLWRSMDPYDHVNDFISADELSSLLKAAGFEIIVFSQQEKIQWHADVKSILRALRQVGVHNTLADRAPGLTGKKHWEKLANAYEIYRDTNKGLPVTYEVYQGVAFSRGSASLAKTLFSSI